MSISKHMGFKRAMPSENIDGDALAWQAALPVPKLTPELA